MRRGIVLRSPSPGVEQQAQAKGLGVVIDSSGSGIPFQQTLLLGERVQIPWRFLGAGFGLLDHWDAVIPIWRYNLTAADLGTQQERRLTELVTLDLRIPVLATEVIFIKPSESGKALLARWAEERLKGSDEHLALLRAMFAVKPLVCVTPSVWLEAAAPAAPAAPTRLAQRPERVPVIRGQRKALWTRVEVAPGVYVRCNVGREEEALRQYQDRTTTRLKRGG